MLCDEIRDTSQEKNRGEARTHPRWASDDESADPIGECHKLQREQTQGCNHCDLCCGPQGQAFRGMTSMIPFVALMNSSFPHAGPTSSDVPITICVK